MTTVAVVSSKGGVGKTTLALNMSFALAKRGWRTLLVDADPQGGVGLSLSGNLGKGGGLAAYVSGRQGLSSALVRTRLPEFHLMPVGSMSFADGRGFVDALSDGSPIVQLTADAGHDYDLIIVDTPGGLSAGSLGCARASDFIVAPVQAEPLALRAFRHLLEALASLRASGSRTTLAGLVLTMVQADDPISQQVVDEIVAELPDYLLARPFIPRESAFLRASAAGVPVALLSRRPPPIAKVFDALAEDLEVRLELRKADDEDDGPQSLLF